ncbi:MAG: hypothetical protein ACO1OG_11905 [Devosia sp.]
MLIRTLTAVLIALSPIALPAPLAAPALIRSQQASIAELMQATALDVVFSQFAATIAASARSEDISRDEIFLKHWETAATVVFDADLLRTRLERALEGTLTDDERDTLRRFFASEFGQRMTRLERDAALLNRTAQIAAIKRGEKLLAGASVVRSTQVDRLMELVAAEISAAMVGQSVRALLLGLSVSHQNGDISVPWPEIDAQVEAMMPALLADVNTTQRAMMAFAYAGLTDDELETYVEFLATPAAQKFYAVAAYSVGRIVANGMSEFGAALADRMHSVNI